MRSTVSSKSRSESRSVDYMAAPDSDPVLSNEEGKENVTMDTPAENNIFNLAASLKSNNSEVTFDAIDQKLDVPIDKDAGATVVKIDPTEYEAPRILGDLANIGFAARASFITTSADVSEWMSREAFQGSAASLAMTRSFIVEDPSALGEGKVVPGDQDEQMRRDAKCKFISLDGAGCCTSSREIRKKYLENDLRGDFAAITCDENSISHHMNEFLPPKTLQRFIEEDVGRSIYVEEPISAGYQAGRQNGKRNLTYMTETGYRGLWVDNGNADDGKERRKRYVAVFIEAKRTGKTPPDRPFDADSPSDCVADGEYTFILVERPTLQSHFQKIDPVAESAERSKLSADSSVKNGEVNFTTATFQNEILRSPATLTSGKWAYDWDQANIRMHPNEPISWSSAKDILGQISVVPDISEVPWWTRSWILFRNALLSYGWHMIYALLIFLVHGYIPNYSHPKSNWASRFFITFMGGIYMAYTALPVIIAFEADGMGRTGAVRKSTHRSIVVSSVPSDGTMGEPVGGPQIPPNQSTLGGLHIAPDVFKRVWIYLLIRTIAPGCIATMLWMALTGTKAELYPTYSSVSGMLYVLFFPCFAIARYMHGSERGQDGNHVCKSGSTNRDQNDITGSTNDDQNANRNQNNQEQNGTDDNENRQSIEVDRKQSGGSNHGAEITWCGQNHGLPHPYDPRFILSNLFGFQGWVYILKRFRLFLSFSFLVYSYCCTVAVPWYVVRVDIMVLASHDAKKVQYLRGVVIVIARSVTGLMMSLIAKNFDVPSIRLHAPVVLVFTRALVLPLVVAQCRTFDTFLAFQLIDSGIWFIRLFLAAPLFETYTIVKFFRRKRYRMQILPPIGFPIVAFRMFLVEMESRAQTVGFGIVLLLFPFTWIAKSLLAPDANKTIQVPVDSNGVAIPASNQNGFTTILISTPPEDRLFAMTYDYFFPRGVVSFLWVLLAFLQELMQDLALSRLYGKWFGNLYPEFSALVGYYNSPRTKYVMSIWLAPLTLAAAVMVQTGVAAQLESKGPFAPQ